MQKQWFDQNFNDFWQAAAQKHLMIPIAEKRLASSTPLEMVCHTAPDRIAIRRWKDATALRTASRWKGEAPLSAFGTQRRLDVVGVNAACAESRVNPRLLTLPSANVDDFKRLNERIREEAMTASHPSAYPFRLLRLVRDGVYTKLMAFSHRSNCMETHKSAIPIRYIVKEVFSCTLRRRKRSAALSRCPMPW